MNKKLIPLAVIDASRNSEVCGITRFQKLVFIAQRQTGCHSYHFTAGMYGPFSEGLHHDIELLIDGGFIDKATRDTQSGNNITVYTLTELGSRAIAGARDSAGSLCDDLDALSEAVADHDAANLWTLLESVHESSPQQFKNSCLNV